MAQTKNIKVPKVMTLASLIKSLQDLQAGGVSPKAKVMLAGDSEGNSFTYMRQTGFWTVGKVDDSWGGSVDFTPVESEDAIPYADSLVLWPG